ncbi:hypothetical protein DY000_02025466 [Brassica cretica]|uniref:RPW8 domain-containing protein n=2 Tax=Brassica cretica TaxID=69181 RepID=A0ABQ7ELG4_BRACR|nr:hypothetical protein DY000_02025466 [Brassica cretica]
MSDVVDLGVSSVAGAVVSELLKAVIEEAKLVVSFKSVYMELASTMEKMLPIIMEIEMLQRAEELQDLDNIINEARVLPALSVVACHAASEQQIIIHVVPAGIVFIWLCPSGGEGELGWASVHSLAFLIDLEMMSAATYLFALNKRNDEDEDSLYNRLLVTQHSILRDLAICQSKSEEHHERKRLNLEIREDKFPDWCLDLTQSIRASLSGVIKEFFRRRGPTKTQKSVTKIPDDLFSSTWVAMDCPNVEALVLNLSSTSYALPNFIATMMELKVVIIKNHGIGPAKLTNLSCLSSLPNLKRIRLEKISITLVDILLSRLGSLEKLSLFMCSFSEVSYNIEEIAIPEALPSLQEIDINCCYDLEQLPDWVSEVVSLKKLSITNCGKLSVLPKAIDITDCLAFKKLPLEIGKLRKLDQISMRRCSVCELPDSVRNLKNLVVKCDEETGLLWERLEPEMRNLRIMMEK